MHAKILNITHQTQPKPKIKHYRTPITVTTFQKQKLLSAGESLEKLETLCTTGKNSMAAEGNSMESSKKSKNTITIIKNSTAGNITQWFESKVSKSHVEPYS